jgi:hypothetical protein
MIYCSNYVTFVSRWPQNFQLLGSAINWAYGSRDPDPKEIFMDPEHRYQGRNAAPHEVERKSEEPKDYPYLSRLSVCIS